MCFTRIFEEGGTLGEYTKPLWIVSSWRTGSDSNPSRERSTREYREKEHDSVRRFVNTENVLKRRPTS
ncbi:hypothetical protein C8R44DRAFT_759214 [Mycena epipterygia]|nr:hypothetical protein C8R44DRAFT_759214 [Mycena epipterygia]